MRTEFFTTTCLLALTLGLSSVSFADEADKDKHPLVPAIKYAKTCLEKVEALPGYEATFWKKEVVGSSTVSHKMKLKIRHKPFSVYLYFMDPHEGREVIYVEGQNNGKLIAHEAGLFSIAGAMELDPTSSMAMRENRYPITNAGIANTLKIMIQQWEEELKYGEIEVKYFKDARIEDMTCRVIEASHPTPRKQFNSHKVRLWVDMATGIPVRMQKYGFPRRSGEQAPLVEEYTFTNLRTNTRLSDADFSKENSKYSF